MPTFIGKRKRNGTRGPIKRATRARTRTRTNVPRGMRPGIYHFKRSITEVVPLNSRGDEGTQPTTGYFVNSRGLVTMFVFTLSQLNDFRDFANLFRKYKITKVKTEIYISANSTVNAGTATDNGNLQTQQIMIYCNPNKTGLTPAAQGQPLTSALTEQHFLDTQTAKKYPGVVGSNRPITIWHDVAQLSNVYNSPTQGDRSDYRIMKPGFISTKEPNTEHLGMNMRVQAMGDGTGNEVPMPGPVEYTNAVPLVMKVTHTVYLTCSGVE